MKSIHRVGIGSVFKVAAVINGLLFAIFGCLFMVLPGILGSGLMRNLAYDSGLPIFGGGVVTTLVIYLVGIVAFSLLYGIFFAIAALVYNLAAGWVGGVEIEVD